MHWLQLCGADVSEKLSSQQRQALAKRKLLHLVAYKTQELQLFSCKSLIGCSMQFVHVRVVHTQMIAEEFVNDVWLVCL